MAQPEDQQFVGFNEGLGLAFTADGAGIACVEDRASTGVSGVSALVEGVARPVARASP